jgi:hypothetical protein
VADEVWIVDGPISSLTIIRCGESDLFVHSPTLLIDTPKTKIEAVCTPRWIIGLNRIHYWWIPQWKVRFPDAQVYLAPRIKEQAKDRIDFAFAPLDRDSGYPWDADIATLPVRAAI